MNSIAKTMIRNPTRYIYKHLYSTSSDKKTGKIHVELCDIPTDTEIDFEVEEVRIRLPWKDATIAGKWWGSKDQRPIVCLHGWQDNAGTFDRLIPLLPRDRSFLALDLPGHGLSSRVPDGLAYHGTDNLYILNFLCKEYNWEKISLMGHSMGSILSWIFATVFPTKVDMLIQIDALKPQVYDPVKVVESLENRITNFIIADQRNQEKSEPPSYTFDEMVERVVTGTYGSVTKETAEYLLKRNIKKSEKYPGKYYFTRDSRLKHNFPSNFQQELNKELAKRINMPHIFIKALNAPYWEKREYFNEILDIHKKNPKFENHVIDSTHHVQLTEPEKIAPLITDFLEKYGKIDSKL